MTIDLKATGAIPVGVRKTLGLPISVKLYGATGDGTTNDTTAIQAAIDAADTAGQDAFFPAGTYMVDGITSDGAGIVGEGPGVSVIKARNGATLVLDVDPASTSRVHCRGFTLDLTNATAADGMHVNNVNYQSVFEDIKVYKGATGVRFTNTGHTFVNRVSCRDQTGNGFLLDGDDNAEVYLNDCDAGRDSAGTLTYGFAVVRTDTSDPGGLYMKGCRATAPTGTLDVGFRFIGTGGVAPIPTFMSQCVADNCTTHAMQLTDVQNMRFVDNWFTNPSGFAIRMEDGQDFTFISNWFAGSSGSFEIHGAPIHVDVHGNRLNTGEAFYFAAGGAAGWRISGNNLSGSSAITNDFSTLLASANQATDFMLRTMVLGGLSFRQETAGLAGHDEDAWRLVCAPGTGANTAKFLWVGPDDTFTLLQDNVPR